MRTPITVSRRSRRSFTVAATAVWLLLLFDSFASAQNLVKLHHTGYDPQVDSIPVKNTTDPVLARHGSCNGIAELNSIYYRARRKNPSLKPLGTVMREIASRKRSIEQLPGSVKKEGGTAYVQKITNYLQALAQPKTYAEISGYYSGQQKQSSDVLQRIDNRFSNKPTENVALHLYNDSLMSRTSHRVEAYATYKKGNGVVISVDDPNFPASRDVLLEHDGNHWVLRSKSGVVGRYTDVGLVRTPQKRPEFWRVLEMARRGLPLELIKKEMVDPAARRPGRSPGDRLKVDVVKDKVNGVRIRFDPTAYSELLSDKDRAHLDKQVGALLKSNEGALHLDFGARTETFRVESLRDLLRNEAKTLGNLTRVRGFVLKPDDLLLVGLVEPGRPKINMDVLTVALRAVYQRGLHPFVSLDPSPDDLYGPQHTRVGGLPADVRDSELVRIMLDADYDMKRINLGELRVGVERYRSWHDLLLERRSRGEAGGARFWLEPTAFHAGDVKVSGPALIFESEVKVLTERLKKVGNYLVGTGEVDPISEEAAEQMTEHYGAIEKHVDSFQRLHAVFDVAKLCAILRLRSVRRDVLDNAARRSVRSVEIPRHYDGIGPKRVGDTLIRIGGGASARVAIRKHAFVTSVALGDLLKGKRTITLERSYPMDVTLNAGLLMNASIEAFADNRLEECVDYAAEAIEQDPELKQSRIYRSIALFQLGRPAEAREDVDQLIALDGRLLAFRGLLRVHVNDLEGALEDVAAAEAKFPDSDCVLLWSARAKLLALDFPGAEESLNHYLSLAPLDRRALYLRDLLDTLYRLGPARARLRMTAIRNLPIPIAEAYVEGLLASRSFAFETGAKRLRDCLALIEKESETGALRAFHLRERCLFELVLALNAQGRVLEALQSPETATILREARRHAEELLRLRPDWPSTYLIQGIGGGKPLTIAEALDLVKKVKAVTGAADPLLEDLTVRLGSRHALAHFVLSLFVQLAESGGNQPVSRERITDLKKCLDEVINELGNSLAGKLFLILSKEDELGSRVQALKKLREVHQSIPEDVPGDSVSVLALCTFYHAYLKYELEVGDPEHFRGAASKYLRITSRCELLDYATLKQLTLQRIWITSRLVGAYHVRRFRDHPSIPKLRQQLANGSIDPPMVRQALVKAQQGILDKELRDGSPFVAGLAAMKLQQERERVEADLKEVAERYVRIDARTEEERQRLKQALLRWTPPADKTDAKRRFDRTWGMMVDGAKTVVEIETVTTLVEFLKVIGGEMAQRDAEIAAGLPAMLSLLTHKARMKRPQATPRAHDWSTWSDPPLPAVASPQSTVPPPTPPTPQPAASQAPSTSWHWIVLFGVVVSASLALALKARRKSRAPSTGERN